MAVIGRDTIEVVYDGTGMPAEAERLGHETGAAAGEGHAKAFDEETKKGFDKTGKDLEGEAKRRGGATGRGFADEFEKGVGTDLGTKLRQNVDKAFTGLEADFNKFVDGLDADAARLGEATGGRSGAEHAKAFNDEVVGGFDHTAQRIEDDAATRGALTGRRYADEFATSTGQELGDKLRANVDRAFDGIDRDFNRSISNMDVSPLSRSFSNLKASVEDYDRQLLRSKSATEDYQHSIDTLGERLSANVDRAFAALAGDIDGFDGTLRSSGGAVDEHVKKVRELPPAWKEASSAVAKFDGDIDGLGTHLRGNVNNAFDELEAKFTRAMDALPHLDDGFQRAYDAIDMLRDPLRSSKDELHGLTSEMDDNERKTRTWHTGVAGMIRDWREFSTEVGTKARKALQEGFASVGPEAEKAAKATEAATAKAAKAAAKVGTEAEKAGKAVAKAGEDGAKAVGKLGTEAEKAGKAVEKVGAAAEKSGKALSGLFTGVGGGFGGGGGGGSYIAMIIGAIIALLGPLSVLTAAAAGGLTILGASALGAVGGLVAFYAIFKSISSMDTSTLNKLPGQMKANALAWQNMIGVYDKTGFQPGKLFTGLQTGLTNAFLGTKGLDTAMNAFTKNTLPQINSALKPVGTALGDLFKKVMTGLGSKNGLTELEGLIHTVSALLPGLGKLFGDTFGIIGQLMIDATPFAHKFQSDLDKMLKSFLDFLRSPTGHDAVTQWLNNTIEILGRVGTVIGKAIDGISKLASDPAQISDTASALQSLGDAVPNLIELGSQLGVLAPAIASALKDLSGMAAVLAAVVGPVIGGLQEMHQAFIINLNGILNFVNDFVSGVSTVFLDLAHVMGDVLKHDLAATIVDSGKLAQDTGAAVKKMGQDVAASFGQMSALFDNLDASSKSTLNQMTASFGITGAAAKDAGGVIVSAAGAAGVSLDDLSSAKSIDDLIGKLGLVGPAADDFRTALVKDAAASGNSLALLNSGAKAQLKGISTNLGLTGQSARTFQEKVAEMTGGNVDQLKKLARDKSLSQVIADLGLTGAKADAFRKLFASSMGGAGASADGAKGKVKSFGDAVLRLPNGKTVTIKEAGAASAATAVGNLAQKINALRDREVSILVNYQTTGVAPRAGGAQVGGLAGALGGLVDATGFVAGGRPFGSGRRYAYGGLLTNPTWLNSGALAGEDGLEAVVPLNKPINQVDPSVRELAMIARGLSPYATAAGGAGGRNVTVAAGAIQVTEAGNGRTTAAAVLDRLAAKLGG